MTRRKFCLRLYYNGANSNLFLNGTEIIIFKVKDCEIVGIPLYLGHISKYFSVNIMKKTVLNGYVFDIKICFSE